MPSCTVIFLQGYIITIFKAFVRHYRFRIMANIIAGIVQRVQQYRLFRPMKMYYLIQSVH
jgi:hypothetical protein